MYSKSLEVLNPARAIMEKDYEEYKLQWLQNHGFTFKNLCDALERIQKDNQKCSVSELMKKFEENKGFGGSVWMSFEEYCNR